ncbi:MAG: Pyridoxal phosphate phosphatase YbhA [bacterium ADurb.Bin243]|nr:MAG: Pyridoxal phosphate phosphatase YbhA [bacterium ADurb.Bin243]
MKSVASAGLDDRLKNIKYLAIDMDGTLLPDDKNIPDFTLDVLREAADGGYTVCICTGRSFGGVYKYEQLRPIVSYYVCFEGGYIINNTVKAAPELIFNYRIPPKEAGLIAEASKKNGAMLALLTNKDGYCLDCDEDIFKSVKIWGSVPQSKTYEDICSAIKNNDIYIALVYGDRSQIDAVWETFSSGIGGRLDAINTYLDFKDLHHLVLKPPGVNKWNGIARVLELNGAGADKLIAFGDWHNDFEMIKNAGVGVAMKNAEASIIEAAMVITAYNNNEEGVARFIKEKLLKIVGDGR